MNTKCKNEVVFQQKEGKSLISNHFNDCHFFAQSFCQKATSTTEDKELANTKKVSSLSAFNIMFKVERFFSRILYAIKKCKQGNCQIDRTAQRK